MDADQNSRIKALLTPAGAAIAMISFFLPWIRISCLGKSSYGGYQFGGIFWIIFAMAALILIAYFALKLLKRLNLLRFIVIGCVIIATIVVVYGCLTVAGGKRILLIRLGPDDVNLRLHVGSYGTILGFIMALGGVIPIPLKKLRPKSENAEL